MTHPYVHGVHRQVGRELDAADLPIIGQLPAELAGTFVRNSADPVHGPGPRYHWFDGDGLVHGFHIEDGRVRYRSRWIHTRGFELERQAGRRLWSGINERPMPDSPGGPVKDTANTDLVVWNGQLVATWWLTGQPMALSCPDLDTLGPARAGAQRLPHMAAHPKVDPRTGELVFMGYDPFRAPYLHYGVAKPDGRVRVEPIDIPHGHIPHDIALTERFTVLMDFPLGWDLAGGKRQIRFFRDRPSRFGVLPRDGGNDDVRWFEHDPCYVYHLDGSWEEGDDIVIVGCRVADPIPDRPHAGVVPLLDRIELVPQLYRWRIHTATGDVTGEVLDDVPTEFPRVDDRSWGRPVRHLFHPRVAPQRDLTFDGLVAYDLATNSSRAIDWPDGLTSGEVVFAPRPGGSEGDDGWLVTVLSSPASDRSRLVVLDARELVEVARVDLPFHVPQGFHAEWVPAGAVG